MRRKRENMSARFLTLALTRSKEMKGKDWVNMCGRKRGKSGRKRYRRRRTRRIREERLSECVEEKNAEKGKEEK